MAHAILESYNQSPRKVRLVTDLVKGKKVTDALKTLQFLPKRAALPVAKLIQSAAANATQKGDKAEDLMVENIIVEANEVLKTYMPRAFGRASIVRGRKSRVKVTVQPTAQKAAK